MTKGALILYTDESLRGKRGSVKCTGIYIYTAPRQKSPCRAGFPDDTP